MRESRVVEAAAAGAEGRLGAEAVFVAHQAGLVRLGSMLCGSVLVAEEAVAEVFARAWAGLEAGRVRDPGAYLRRALVNELRRQRRRRPDGLAVGAGRGVVEGLEDAMVERDRVLRGLLGLPVRQREVLVLRFLEDRSEAEVAAVLGISVGAVKRHGHRGLARLREEWGEHV